MATETVSVEEAAEAPTNGEGPLTPAETAEIIYDTFVEPKERETVPRFGDPRDAVVTIVRDRLERMLQPVDDDPVWHGVNVITAKGLGLATAEPLPPASIFAASVRTPAYIYVDAVCPVCNIASEVSLEIGVRLIVEGHSRKLKLTAKAADKPHRCGQQRLEDLSPTSPAQMSLDDVEPNAGDADFGEGAPNADSDDGEPDEDLEVTNREAIHTLAAVKPAQDEPDDLEGLPL